jgi:excisionase family DNA binding protein
MGNDTPTLLKIEQAARVLNVGRTRAYQMAADGSLPGVVRIGKSIRVNVRALDRWIEENTGPKPAA